MFGFRGVIVGVCSGGVSGVSSVAMGSGDKLRMFVM